ncbi:MAG: YfiR family protein [Nitrosomonas sp.]|jgi:hypothetical protein|nr:YfiR family protein [Nitrosomonas sp.]
MTFFLKNFRNLKQFIERLIVKCTQLPGKSASVISHDNSRHRRRLLIIACSIFSACWYLLLSYSPIAQAQQPSEYRLKVAFLYNFAAYTEWPSLPEKVLNLCIHGDDPFGEDLQHLRQKKVNEYEILIRQTNNVEELATCQIVFIARSAVRNLSEIIDQLNGRPILTIADTPGTSRQGVMLNMAIKEGKVTFEANDAMAKKNHLKLSSQLLRFATEVYQ